MLHLTFLKLVMLFSHKVLECFKPQIKNDRTEVLFVDICYPTATEEHWAVSATESDSQPSVSVFGTCQSVSQTNGTSRKMSNK